MEIKSVNILIKEIAIRGKTSLKYASLYKVLIPKMKSLNKSLVQKLKVTKKQLTVKPFLYIM